MAACFSGVPNAVWTVKRSVSDEFDAYIVVSFVNATLVLSIGETVEEVSDSGFLDTTPSLAASLLGDDSLMQARGEAGREGGREGERGTRLWIASWVVMISCHVAHVVPFEEQGQDMDRKEGR